MRVRWYTQGGVLAHIPRVCIPTMYTRVHTPGWVSLLRTYTRVGIPPPYIPQGVYTHQGLYIRVYILHHGLYLRVDPLSYPVLYLRVDPLSYPALYLRVYTHHVHIPQGVYTHHVHIPQGVLESRTYPRVCQSPVHTSEY